MKIKSQLTFFLGIMVFVFASFLGINIALGAVTTQDLQPAANLKTLTYNNNVIWSGDLTANTTITVGTSTNKGVLNVKGYIKNPNKKKPVLVKDDLKVTGDLEIKGKIKGKGVVKSRNIAADAINENNIDFSTNGIVKAALDVSFYRASTPTKQYWAVINKQFNTLGNKDITVVKSEVVNEGLYDNSFHEFDLGFNIDDRYIATSFDFANIGWAFSTSTILIRNMSEMENKNHLGLIHTGGYSYINGAVCSSYDPSTIDNPCVSRRMIMIY